MDPELPYLQDLIEGGDVDEMGSALKRLRKLSGYRRDKGDRDLAHYLAVAAYLRDQLRHVEEQARSEAAGLLKGCVRIWGERAVEEAVGLPLYRRPGSGKGP